MDDLLVDMIFKLLGFLQLDVTYFFHTAAS